MSGRLPFPSWAFLALLPVCAVVAGVLVAQQNAGSDRDDRALASSPVTDGVLGEAVAAAKSSSAVPAEARAQEWAVRDARPGWSVDGHTTAMFTAVWDEPVDADGPWSILQCQGTRIHETDTRWHDVTAMLLTVDTETERVVALSVATPPLSGPKDSVVAPRAEGLEQEPVTVRDAATGAVLGTTGYGDPLECPAGSESD